MYAITATIVIGDPLKVGQTTRQLPIFYLDETVQGITSAEHAKDIALDIVCACQEDRNSSVDSVYITAEKI